MNSSRVCAIFFTSMVQLITSIDVENNGVTT
jgi:hypothetical protein